jgi:predicted acetyltransferase
MTDFPLRPISEAEWPGFHAVLSEAFNSSAPEVTSDRWKAVIEFDRTLAAFDGEQIVGCTAVHSFTMTVPGGPVPVGGVTAVGVLPSHRRRGILSALMRRQLTDLHEGGEALAALYASEPGIYGRFGYGRAAEGLFLRIRKAGSRFRPDAPVDPALRLRVARPKESRPLLEKVFEAVVTSRPGLFARDSARWDELLADEEIDRHGGAGPLRCLLAEDDHGPRGYALFRVKGRITDHDVPDGELSLIDLFALDSAAYALVWRGVLDRDLIAQVHAWNRPVDDPVLHLLADVRQAGAGWLDELWMRVVDVARALPARAYSAPVDVVIGVRDPVCPWNDGRWRLSADTSGATCAPTRDPADLTLPADTLGASYLGGRVLAGAAGAGLVTEHTPGALHALSTAMSWPVMPWTGLIF